MEENIEIKCPKCGSHSLSVNQKGFSVGKAAVGGALLGGIGLLAGGIGSKDIRITCLNCNNVFTPQDWQAYRKEEEERQKQLDRIDNIMSGYSQEKREEAKRDYLADREKEKKSDDTMAIVIGVLVAILAIVGVILWVN